MDRRSPEILLDVFNRFQIRLLFLFFVSREGEGGEEIEEGRKKQWWATCKLIPCVRT